MIIVPYPETVTVVRVATDKFGDRTDGATHDVSGCAVYPRMAKAAVSITRSVGETTSADDIVAFGLGVLMPPGSDVLATDRVIVQGNEYEVDGNPTAWSSPLSNFQPGIEVLLKRVTG